MNTNRRQANLCALCAIASSLILSGCSGCVSPSVDEMIARQNAALESAAQPANQEAAP